MSRVFKFRAWDNKKKKMGSTFELDDASYEGFPQPFVDENGECDLKADYVVMQFVCISDKNDKEIYEEDIVEIDGSGRCRVVYLEPAMKFYYLSLKPGTAEFAALRETIEVIGNAYENPDLLI